MQLYVVVCVEQGSLDQLLNKCSTRQPIKSLSGHSCMQSCFCHFRLNGRNSSNNRWPERGRAASLLLSFALLTGLPWQRNKRPQKQIRLSDIYGGNSAHVMIYDLNQYPANARSSTADVSGPSKTIGGGRGSAPTTRLTAAIRKDPW